MLLTSVVYMIERTFRIPCYGSSASGRCVHSSFTGRVYTQSLTQNCLTRCYPLFCNAVLLSYSNSIRVQEDISYDWVLRTQYTDYTSTFEPSLLLYRRTCHGTSFVKA
jgi:hypothetical protein